MLKKSMCGSIFAILEELKAIIFRARPGIAADMILSGPKVERSWVTTSDMRLFPTPCFRLSFRLVCNRLHCHYYALCQPLAILLWNFCI